MPLQCPRCGTKNEDGKQVCAVCSGSLAGAAVVPPAGVPLVSRTYTAPAASADPPAAQAPPVRPAVPASPPAAQAPPEAQQIPPAPPAVKAQPGPQQVPPATPAEQAPTQTQQATPEPGGVTPAEQMRAGLPIVPSASEEQPPASRMPDELDSFLLEGPPVEEGAPLPEAPVPQQPTGPFNQPAYPAWGSPYTSYGQYPQYSEFMPPYGYGFPPVSPYGAYGPYPSYGFFPPMPFFGGYPPYGPPYMPPYPPPMAGYPGYGAPMGYPAQYPQAYGATPRKRMKTVYIILIIILALLVVGGAVTAAVLLTGKGSSAFKLGDGSVTGTDIEFRNMLLSQKSGTLTLSGIYDNNTKRSGEVFVTVQGTENGNEQLISFTVPVKPGTGKTFSQKKSSSVKLTAARLGALIYRGTTNTNNNGTNSFPWESTTPSNPSNQTGTTPSNETTPSNGSESTTPSF